MLEVLASPPSDAIPQGDARWNSLIDALLTGDCNEDDFVSRVCDEQADTPDAAWSAVAILDQRFRRGQVSADLYRSIGIKISQRELRHSGDGTTVNQRTHRWKRLLAQQPTSTQTTPQPHTLVGPSLIEEKPIPRVIESGRVLRDRYELEGRLGSGGMGTIYKALDRFRADLREDGRHVAIKILHDTTVDEDMGRLRREFFCAQGLSHPHIIKVFEIDRDADVAFFTMELLEGTLLDALICEARPGAAPRSVAWIVIRDVGSALAYAHSRQVVHGDLKPQNIMITDKGDVRVLDFGASSDPSRQGGTGDAKHEVSELTPAYACIEVLEGQAPEPADDLYALACLSYELLTGKHPFDGHTAIEARDLQLIPSRPHALSERQWETLRAGLACGRSDRIMPVADWAASMMPEPLASQAAPTSGSIPDSVAVPVEQVAQPDAGPGVGKGAQLDVPAQEILPPPLPLAALTVTAESASAKPETSARLFDSREPPLSPLVLPPPSSSRSVRMPNSTLLIAVLFFATIWAAISRPWTGARLASDQVPSRIQVVTEIDPLGVTVEPEPPEVLAIAVSASDVVPGRDGTAVLARSDVPPQRLRFSAGSYRVPAGQGFAELRVIRPGASGGDAGFVWWTEGGSALAGLDYVAQNPAMQLLAGSQRRATLFVKVPASVDRTTRKTFFVAMKDPHGRSIDGIVRAMVTIPAQAHPRQLLSSAAR